MIRIVIGLVLLSLADSLVHYVKLPPGADGGCKGAKGDFKVDEIEKDPLTCGVFVCQNNNGDALIHYCQIPVTFADCDESGVKTTADWPDCCWLCVLVVACKKT